MKYLEQYYKVITLNQESKGLTGKNIQSVSRTEKVLLRDAELVVQISKDKV